MNIHENARTIGLVNTAVGKGTRREQFSVTIETTNSKETSSLKDVSTDDEKFRPSRIPPLICTKPISMNNLPSSVNLSEEEKQKELCEREYGCGLLQTWKQQAIEMCEKDDYVIPSSGLIDLEKKKEMETNQATLTCYKNNNKHVDSDTFPHTVCESSNLVMDFSKLKRVPCLKYRPGYNCKRKTYYTYLAGALLGKCKRNPVNLDLSQFSKHFGKEIFSSFKTFKEENFKEKKDKVEYIDGVTIFVTREQDDHANLFHALSDFFATFQMIEMFKLDSKNVQIVLLDEHYESPYDFLWNSTFSLKRPARKASYFKEKTVRFERAIFQHAGVATQLKSNLLDFSEFDPSQCKSKVRLVTAFSDRILSTLGIEKRRPSFSSSDEMIRGLFVSSGKITNEDEVLINLKKHPEYGYTFTLERIDLNKFSFVEQVKRVHQADFLIGYHDLGLTNSLFLPDGTSGLLEIWKTYKTRSMRSFEQYSRWKGNEYTLWTNMDMKAINGDNLTVKLESFLQTFGIFLTTLRNSRAK
ncbi:predicted protein [Naegleria gruberi]|uniref:EGF domain-specific O-linked N-acetylglucosamine transferase n=1 Tax=Naegleria gruberi TaxID=5762 RepID=D2VW74_NAEGR|nr:uncharacterized protein NAEGRDRAFT_73281 [Naegleria gruberi]EFC39031.1 predicted protein [Naegleria gruberi]|eukprot:XP_002671775.1 predicted protein [Naegleria gruberi strain NEG-M]